MGNMRDTSNNAADEVESRHEKQGQDKSLQGRHVRSVFRPMRAGDHAHPEKQSNHP